MKKLYLFLLLGVMAVVFAGCSQTSSNIEYLPCKTERNADWGFVDNKGNVYCADMFKRQPSYVRDGIFSVKEANDLYTIYTFDVKKPQILLEDLKYVGSPREGLLPICRKDHCIEIINTKGETQFTLDRVKGKPVTEADNRFFFGYLVFKTEDGKFGLVDKRGQVLIEPVEYTYLYPLKKNYIYAVIDGDRYIVNDKGEKYDQWKPEDLTNMKFNCINWEEPNDYIVLEKEDRYYIYTVEGEMVLKCPERVKGISQIRNGFFAYEGEDGTGVMNMKGERIVTDKYHALLITDKEFLARRDLDHDCELINFKGESIRKVDDFKPIYVYFGWGIVGMDGREYAILNDNYEAASKVMLYDLEGDNYDEVYSDFLDITYLTGRLVNAMSDKLYDWELNFGTKIGNNDFLQEQSMSQYSSDYCKISYADAHLYDIDLYVHFDRDSREAVYETVQVQRYSYWYGYYTDTERRFSHYDRNANALLKTFEFRITVPEDKREDFMNALCDELGNKNTEVSRDANNAEYAGTYKYTVKRSGRTIYYTIRAN